MGRHHGLDARDDGVDVLVLVAPVRLVGWKAREDLRGGAAERIAVTLAQPLRDRAHVVAAVAVGWKPELLAAQLEVTQPHAGREDVHLAARVVHVVLAVHAPAVGREQVRDAGAEGGMPAVADVQGPGRIRGHELDDGPAARAPGTAA